MSEAPIIEAASGPAPGVQPLVTELRERLVERLGHALHRMMEKVDDALFELAEKSENIANQSLYFDAMREVRLKRATIEDAFRIYFREGFDERAQRRDVAAEESAASGLPEGNWGLLEHDAVEEQIAVNNLGDKVSNACREELYALDQRVGVLLGVGTGQALGQQPAAPAVVCEAIRRSLVDLQSGLKVRLIILKLFDRYVAGELLVIYHDCNEWMVSKGILTELRTQLRNPRPGRGLVASPSAGSGPAEGEAVPLDEASLVQALRSLLTGEGIPSGMSGTGGAVAVAGSVNGLTALQRGDGQSWSSVVAGDVAWVEGLRGEVNVLRSLKGTGVARAFGPAGDLTIDIVAMLFDYILDDRSIPSPLRALIGRLQIPVVKVALLDTGFFSRKSHPARRLLNTLAEAAAGWSGVPDESDPLYSTMEQLVTRVNREFEQEVSLFAEVLDQFERFLIEDGERRQLRAERTRRVIGSREESVSLRERVRAEVEARTADGALNDVVRGFLATHWHKLLQLLAQQHGTDSAPWRDALLTMDDLLASVTPKTALEERRRLSAKLPDLLGRLKAGMERIELPAVARKRFLMDLARVHSDAVRGRDTAGNGEAMLIEQCLMPTDSSVPGVSDAWPPEFDAESEADVAAMQTTPAPMTAADSAPTVEPAEAVPTLADEAAAEAVPTLSALEELFERTQPDGLRACHQEDAASPTVDEPGAGTATEAARALPAGAADIRVGAFAGATSGSVAITSPPEGAPGLVEAASDEPASGLAGDLTEAAATDIALEFASELELELLSRLPTRGEPQADHAVDTLTTHLEAVPAEAPAAAVPETPHPSLDAEAPSDSGIETGSLQSCLESPEDPCLDETDTVQRLHAPALPPIDRDPLLEAQVSGQSRPMGSVTPLELSTRQVRRITEDLERLDGESSSNSVVNLHREGMELPGHSASLRGDVALIEAMEGLTERTQPQENLADVLRARLLQDGEVSLSELVDAASIEERLSRTLPEERLDRTLPQAHRPAAQALLPASMNAEQIMALMASGELDFEEVTLAEPGEGDGLSSRIERADEHTRLVAALETGTWIEFTEEDGNKRQARLTWINSSTDTFMFTDRRGLKVADRTRNGLIADFRRGAAQLVEQSGTFDQWMGRLMDGIGRARQR